MFAAKYVNLIVSKSVHAYYLREEKIAITVRIPGNERWRCQSFLF